MLEEWESQAPSLNVANSVPQGSVAWPRHHYCIWLSLPGPAKMPPPPSQTHHCSAFPWQLMHKGHRLQVIPFPHSLGKGRPEGSNHGDFCIRIPRPALQAALAAVGKSLWNQTAQGSGGVGAGESPPWLGYWLAVRAWISCSISKPHLKTGIQIPTWHDCPREPRTMPHTSQALGTRQRGEGTTWC